MAWNEPGKRPDEQGPPEFDEILRKLSNRLSNLFKSKSNGNQQPPASDNSPPLHFSKPGGFIGLGIVLIGILLIWLLAGIFIVSPAEESVILRLGHYETTVGSGPHWIPRFIESETRVNVQKIDTFSYDAQMLTKDQNIVDVAVAVQYRVDDPKNYLYNVANPSLSLQQATASALRQVIGNTTLDDILTTGRAVVRQNINTQLNSILQLYHVGILVTDVALQPAKAPEQVKDAFDDAIKAQEDEQRFINKAQAYAKGVVPIAQGNAQRILLEAKAYQQQVVLQSQAKTSRYLAILPIYRNAPEVTRSRMYLDTISSILQSTSKVVVDTRSNQNLLYLPLNRLMGNAPVQKVTVPNADNMATSLAQTGDLPGTSATDNTDLSGSRPQRFALDNPDSQVGQEGQ